MVKARYVFDPNLDRPSDDEWIAGPRWVREPREVQGVYCGVKRLHQVGLQWNESASDSDRYAYLSPEGFEELITVYIVALDQTRRVNVLPRDVVE